MFEIVQVSSSGVMRRGLRTIPPQYVSWDDKHLAASVVQGAPLASVVVIPNDCLVVPLGWIRSVIHAAGMFTGAGKMALNPDQPYLLAETVVHELVHYHQRARMGPVGYLATYIAQLPGALIDRIRFGGTVHDWHLQEREARRVANAIIMAHFYMAGVYVTAREGVPLDAMARIQEILK